MENQGKIPLQFRSLLDLVTDIYDLRQINHYHQPAGGLLNHVLHLYTQRGQYILKKHRYRNSEEKIKPLENLLNLLEIKKIAADYVISNREGKSHIKHDGNIYTLHRFIKGNNYSTLSQLNKNQVINAIKFLVKYHSAAWDLNPDGENIKPSELPVVFTDDIFWIRDHVSNHKDIFKKNEDYDFIMYEIAKLEKYLMRNNYRLLPELLIHGDYRFCNMIFERNRIQGIFDWDLLQYAPRIFEATEACGNFSVYLESVESENGVINRFLNFKDLLLIYQKEAHKEDISLMEQEIEAIPEMLRLKSLLTGVNFAILLRNYPLRHGETFKLREERSRRCLDEILQISLALNKINWDSFVSELIK